jgi:ComF family protein
MLRPFLDAMLDALPSTCELCGAWPARTLCERCVHAFYRPVNRCRTCALPLPDPQRQCGACLRQPPVLDACLAVVSYQYPWSHCITRFKYGQHPGWARPLAALMARLAAARRALDDADMVLAMPLSVQRLAERGFNQAHELGRQLAPAKLRSGLLLRIRDTLPQSSLGRAQRLRNVRGAFMVDPDIPHAVRDRRLLLVDDVMTSGASLACAAAALKQAGAARVESLVLARTDEPGHIMA